MRSYNMVTQIFENHFSVLYKLNLKYCFENSVGYIFLKLISFQIELRTEEILTASSRATNNLECYLK